MTDLITKSCPNLCSASDVTQSQSLDKKASITQVQTNTQQITNNVTAAVTNYINDKAPGGIGNSVSSDVNNISKTVSTMLQKNASTILNNASVDQSLKVNNYNLNMISQKQVSTQMLEALQNQTTYQNAVNNIATEIHASTKLSSTHIVIIVILVIVVLCVIVYMIHVYMKNKKSKSGSGAESRKSVSGADSRKSVSRSVSRSESRSISTHRR